MIDPIECEGSPRDLGFDLGSSFRDALRGRYENADRLDQLRLRVGWLDARARRLERDLQRYFPQQAEALDGAARGAEVPFAWLVETLAHVDDDPSPWAASLVLSASGGGSAEAFCSRTIPVGAALRRSRPESGFRSIELTLPWLPTALAGVNEAGLAVAAAAEPRGLVTAGCAAPAVLLVQDCLQRFASVDAALDWCTGRPSGGRATLHLSDASGEVAGVRVEPAGLRVQRPIDGLLLTTAADARPVELAKALREAAPLEPADLSRFLDLDLVVADPARRRLGWLRAAGPAERRDRWIDV